MASKLDRENRRARRMNPLKSGRRTGNPQLEAHEGEDVRSSPRQRTAKPKRRRAVKVRGGERRGG
jgi:hypothetical protein